MFWIQIRDHHMKFISELLNERNKWLVALNQSLSEEEKEPTKEGEEIQENNCPEPPQTLILDIHESKSC